MGETSNGYGKKGLSQDKLSKLADLLLNAVLKIEVCESPNPTIEIA